MKYLQQIWGSIPAKKTMNSVILTYLLVLLGLITFELVEEFFYPDFERWQSQVTTIIFGSLCAGIVAFIVSHRHDTLRQQLIEEIDERKRTQEELQKYQEQLEALVKERTRDLEAKTGELEQANIYLQRANRHKSVFLASMSHELRTPLNSIIGFTGIMLKGMAGEITEEQRKQLGMVKNSANHLLTLINDVLDVSKIEAGKIDFSLEEFGIDELVTETKESVSPAAQTKGLEILTNVPEDITIFSDKRRTKQVLLNLCSNAVKFTDHGTIEVAAKALNDEKVEITVRDTGIGIKGEDMHELFEPFQQVGVSITKRQEGTGLGLYLTKKLVNLLRGEVWAKSRYGEGSEFTVVLPLRYKEESKE
ncbi:sensor histidine kinase [Candidatus Nitrospira allomarina]|uniref:histidine kinase n=1 Tax=Candidatus Nitrospira allomarina TaxID=3020900 RepID=A0AA96GDA5_9BACT|nr:ATP-binding protein [Candidatus Nitrospira allomarina]WNM59177.1 ATP-binding protein [Candidatus Nitrospira allomarina]